MPEIVEEDPTETKSFSEYFWDNMVCNGLAEIGSNFSIDSKTWPQQYIEELEIVEEVPTEIKSFSEYSWDKMVCNGFADVKPKICEEKSSGKNENESYLNSITDISIGPNFSKDSKTWPQQNRDEVGTAVERDNDTRKEPTITINSKVKLRPKCDKLFSIKYPSDNPLSQMLILCNNLFKDKDVDFFNTDVKALKELTM
ncbi:hypothetical protein JTB14_031832 [Gonioctena quinquepunctata]|nr:hypothetical protein JTB14_031832 [Gonioctena quinquepunctata]